VRAIQDLIDCVARELEQTIEAHGEDSPEAVQCLLVLIPIELFMRNLEEVHARIDHYLAISEKIYGRASIQRANGLFLLEWSLTALGRLDEAAVADEECKSVIADIGVAAPIEPMLDALCRFLARLQDNPTSENVRLAFVLALYTLSWLVTVGASNLPSFPCFLERIRPAFEAWGFTDDVWAWLMRRCDLNYTNFLGLISVLLEEGKFPGDAKESNASDTGDPGGDHVLKGYEVFGMKSKHWKSQEGFSLMFPVSVAEGELSLRVERLLAEGCHCLQTTDEMNHVFLVFSPHPIGTRITAFRTDAWTESDQTSIKQALGLVVKEYGADSAMLLAWITIHPTPTSESADEPREAVMVVARDAKSYLVGFQLARKIDGEYVFEEPTVEVTEKNWFSEFRFPVEPAAKKPRQPKEKKTSKKQSSRRK